MQINFIAFNAKNRYLAPCEISSRERHYGGKEQRLSSFVAILKNFNDEKVTTGVLQNSSYKHHLGFSASLSLSLNSNAYSNFHSSLNSSSSSTAAP